MILAVIMLLLPCRAFAGSSEPPFLIQEVETEKDAQAVNQNLRSVSDGLRRLNKTYKSDLLDDNNAFSGNSTFGGSATFNSTVTTRAAVVNTSTVTNSGNVVFNASATFNAGVFGNVHNDTQSVRMTGISWGSVGLVCRSTLTITASTFTVHASVLAVTGGVGNVVAGYLLDGRLLSRFTQSVTCNSNLLPWKSNGDTVVGVNVQGRETVAYGSHTICLWVCADAGTSASGSAEFWATGN